MRHKGSLRIVAANEDCVQWAGASTAGVTPRDAADYESTCCDTFTDPRGNWVSLDLA